MSNLLKAFKSIAVGLVASVISLGGLYLLVDLMGMTPQAANLPTLAAGSVVQFLGNRNWVFLATGGNPVMQMLLFFTFEVASFFLNVHVYNWAVGFSDGHYLLARILVTAAIFWGFNFPLWKWIFKS